VSINPNEHPALAASKKRSYLKLYGRPGAAEGWHFLTGSEDSIRTLSEQVGFRYAYDPASKQYAHPSGLVILTPGGKISRYLFGLSYSPKELSDALKKASANEVGTPIQQLFLLCFHYNPITGKYSGTIIILLRLAAVFTMAGFLFLIFWLMRRARRAQALLAQATVETAGRAAADAPRQAFETYRDV
jgi:protein SCO1/2